MIQRRHARNIKGRKTARRERTAKKLKMERLEARQLLAFNIMDDAFTIASDSALNVLTNDTSGAEVQNVSAMNVDFDPASVNPGGNSTDNFIPERPGQAGVPQRSAFPGAVTLWRPQANYGDIDLYLDGDADPTNDADFDPGLDPPDTSLTRMANTDGIVLGTLRDNSPVDASATNLAVVQYRSNTANPWIATNAAPENSGETAAKFSAAYFPAADGWQGGTFNGSGAVVAGGAGFTVTGSGGRFEVEIDGVTDSFNDGFLFAIGADNEDNYTRARPIEDGKWRVQHRDNSSEIGGAESDSFNLLFIPRGAQGLIGGTVSGAATEANPMLSSFGDFDIQRESDGFWRLSVPGHDITSGVLVMETRDLTVDEPRNSYFTYDVAGDDPNDIIIRQFAWNSNTETPLNTDFSFFFVPFENTLNPTSPLTITEVGTAAAPTSGLTDKGLSIGVNADGTIDYAGGAAIRALGAGETDVDTFTYTATNGSESATATATINWLGVNDAPEILSAPSELTFDEDDPPFVLDLSTVFQDVDANDTLSYSFDAGFGGLLSGSIVGDELTITLTPDAFGATSVAIAATDNSGESASVVIPVLINADDTDNVVAVDDEAITDKVTPVDISVLANDFHPDTSPLSVASALIDADPAANTNATSIWTVTASTPGVNEITVQSAPNVGDVALGLAGTDIRLTDGVLLGTVRDDTSPFQTVNTFDHNSGFGRLAFATDTGIGGGERNSPLHAGFFPFAEGWTSGHVASDGTLLGGVGVSQANITKLGTGLFELEIPEVSNASQDGMLFAMGGNNDDNIVSVLPSPFDNTWQIRQMDSDSNIDGFEDDTWSFVYIPGATEGLIGGRFGGFEEDRSLQQSYGGVSAFEDFGTAGAILVDVPGYSADEGALIAIASGSVFSSVGGISAETPSNHAVFAVPDPGSSDFRIQARQSGDFLPVSLPDIQFVFLPFDSPLERVPGLDFSISSVDATSALGATVSLNPDGTVNYDPSSAGAPIADLGTGESVTDTFTYTIQDGRGGTDTATVTVTVQGENVVPVAGDDVVNLNELSAQEASLTVLGNDVDPDFTSLNGVPQGIAAANLSVDGGGTWSVAGTGSGATAISVGATATGNVEVLRDGAAIAPSDGVVIATVRENFEGDNTSARLVQAFANGSGGTSLGLQQFGGDGAADAPVSLAYFPFADDWTAGHVDASGALVHGNGVAGGNVTRTGTGRYEVTIPGVTDASRDGFLFVIGNEDADNTVQSRAVPGTDRFEVGVRDNQQDFGDGEDGGFSFVFVPRATQNLVAGVIDPGVDAPNSVSLPVGEFTLERLEVEDLGFEYKLSIPGETPDSGMLLLTNQDNNEIEDNYLSYEDDGEGNFLIRSHDMPGLGLQNQPFSFAFVPFGGSTRPEFRPVANPLSVGAVDATSSLGATLSVNPDGTVQYSPGTLLDGLYFDESVVDTFSYTVDDGFGGTDTATVTLNITGFGDAPAVTTTDGLTFYGIGDSPIGVDAAADLLENGTPILDGAVITAEITSGGIATDALAIRNEGTAESQIGVDGTDVTFGGTVIGSFAGGDGTTPLTVTLNASATGESVDRLLRAITFGNSDAGVSQGLREVTFSLVDGGGRSQAAATKQVALRLLRSRELQQGADFGYGPYQSTRDAEIRENSPDTVSNPSTDILIDFPNASNTSQMLLEFGDLFGNAPGQIPVGSVITSATLNMYTDPNTGNAPGDGATLHRMLQDWDDATATWNAFNGNGQAGVQSDDVEARTEFESQIGTASGSSNTGTGLMSFSVLPDLRAWASGETNHGWLLQGWTGNTDGWFVSPSEDPVVDFRPRLSLEWLPPSEFDVATFQQGVDGYDGTVDTRIRGGEPDLDRSADETVFVDASTDQTLLRFDNLIGDTAGQIPAGSTIVTARLVLGSTTSNAQGDGGRFYPMLTPWADTDTWTSLTDGVSADGVEASDSFDVSAGNASRSPDVQGGFNSFDVTADLQRWVSGQIDNNGWAILPWDSGTNGWGFQSGEAPEERERPRLEVYYTDTVASIPTDIALDNDSVVENTDTSAASLLVGTLSTPLLTPNPADTFVYELFEGAGGTDNAMFEIVDDQLFLNQGTTLDFESQPSYLVRVRSTASTGAVIERDLTVNVTDLLEVSSITVGDGSDQRSRVERAVVEFDGEVNLGANALSSRSSATTPGRSTSRSAPSWSAAARSRRCSSAVHGSRTGLWWTATTNCGSTAPWCHGPRANCSTRIKTATAAASCCSATRRPTTSSGCWGRRRDGVVDITTSCLPPGVRERGFGSRLRPWLRFRFRRCDGPADVFDFRIGSERAFDPMHFGLRFASRAFEVHSCFSKNQ